MELWNERIVKESYEVLNKLKKDVDFVIIGGWASWLYTKKIKSKDIDVYINFKDFFNFQEILAEKGIFISLNRKLKKYSVKIMDIDIDIYTPHYCNLIVSCKDVFSKKWFKMIDGFKVILPELLLVLKLKAEEERKWTVKGFKDRIDILTIIHKLNLNKKFLLELKKKYKIDIIKRILNIIRGSKKEFDYFLPESNNLRLLKKLKLELIRKIS